MMFVTFCTHFFESLYICILNDNVFFFHLEDELYPLLKSNQDYRTNKQINWQINKQIN